MRSKKIRDKISRGMKGNQNGLGKKRPQSAILATANALRGIPRPLSVRKKISKSRKGKMIGKDHPMWRGGRKESRQCLQCEKIFVQWIYFNQRYCSKSCGSKSRTAEKNPAYKDGRSKKIGYHAFISARRRTRKKLVGGDHTSEEWESLKIACGYMCLSCERVEPEIKLTEDHIRPISKGGNDNIENIQPLCKSCNSKKMCKIIKFKKPCL